MNNLHSILFFFLLFTANGVNAQFFEKEHTIIDVRNSITWLRCSVGQTWNSNDQTCIGSIVKLNHEEIEIATKQAAEQLGGKWRLPSLEELESLVRGVRAAKDPGKVFSEYNSRSILEW